MAQFQLVRFRSPAANKTFEVMTKPGAALKYREGKLGFDNVLVTDTVWLNQSKGDRASATDLKSAFGTESTADAAKQVVEKGEFSLSTAERKEKVDQKRAEIVNYFHKYFIDPRLNTPHPVTRIELALEEIKARVDPDVPAERQAQELMKRLVDVIPMRKQEIEGTLSVPHKFVPQVSNLISKYAQIRKQDYSAEGCVMIVALVPGDYDAMMADLQRLAHGEVLFDILGGQGGTAHAKAMAQVGDGGGKKKGKKGK